VNQVNRLSYSMIRLYLECPRAYHYRYILGLPIVQRGRLVAGKVYHLGVAYAFKRKLAGALATPTELFDIMSDTWEAQLAERLVYDELGEPKVEAKRIDWEEDDPGKLKDTVLKLAALYLRKMVPKIEPIAVEQKLEGVIATVPFVGYPDLQVRNLTGIGVIDHKFAKRCLSQADADKDIQPSAYAALLGQPIWAAFHQALDMKRPQINEVTTERGIDDIDWFGHLVEQVWRGIRSGIFPPNPLTWKCGADCSYNVECRVLHEY